MEPAQEPLGLTEPEQKEYLLLIWKQVADLPYTIADHARYLELREMRGF